MLIVWLVLSAPWFAVLGHFAARGPLRVSALCVGALLLLIPVAIGVGHSEGADGIGAAFAPVVAAVLGPLCGPVLVLSWASEAPAIGFLALLLGAAVAAAAGYALRGRLRFAVVVAFVLFSVVSWLSAEAFVEQRLWRRADQQFGAEHCIYERRSVLGMIESGETDVLVWPHAKIAAANRRFYWSFRANSWVRDTAEDASSILRCRPRLLPRFISR